MQDTGAMLEVAQDVISTWLFSNTSIHIVFNGIYVLSLFSIAGADTKKKIFFLVFWDF